jgi:hypothetical protein
MVEPVSYFDLRVEYPPDKVGVVLNELALTIGRLHDTLHPQMDGGHLSVVVFDEEGDCVLD